MEINYISTIVSFINIAILILIVIGIVKGIKVLKNHINRTIQMDKRLDDILKKSEKDKND